MEDGEFFCDIGDGSDEKIDDKNGVLLLKMTRMVMIFWVQPLGE